MAPTVSEHPTAVPATKSGFTTVSVATDKTKVEGESLYSSYTYQNALVEKVDGKYTSPLPRLNTNSSST